MIRHDPFLRTGRSGRGALLLATLVVTLLAAATLLLALNV